MKDLYEMKLRAFCKGLEMESIDKLMTGTVADFHKVGQVMSARIKDRCRKPQEPKEGDSTTNKEKEQRCPECGSLAIWKWVNGKFYECKGCKWEWNNPK